MREVFLLMKYNLTSLKIYSKQGQKFKFFCQIGLKYRKIVFKYWKYILNTLKSVSKYTWFGKGRHKYKWNWITPISSKKIKYAVPARATWVYNNENQSLKLRNIASIILYDNEDGASTSNMRRNPQSKIRGQSFKIKYEDKASK